MIKDIIEKAGKKCGIVGTIGVAIGNEIRPTEHTTPESYDLQKYFSQMVEANCDYMVMEVSSQGIMMDRVAGMHFDYGVFTNHFTLTVSDSSFTFPAVEEEPVEEPGE